jgi:tripeptide aminopeptidase
MIDHDELREHFLRLVQTDSLSGREADVAAILAGDLEALGLDVSTDNAGEAFGGNCGNIMARLGTGSGPPLLLNAHMDTVAPGEGVKPVVDGDIIRTDGTTVLGGDDKGGCTTIIMALRHVLAEGLPHPPLEVVFTVSEESGLTGAKQLDYDALTAEWGIVAESGTLGKITIAAPFADLIDATIRGKRAHAGVCPEKGVNAIAAAARGIARMKLGRLDEETTANVGTIHGGDARNVVPEECALECGARSHVEAKLAAQSEHMRQCLEEGAAELGAEADVQVERGYNGFRLESGEPCLALAEDAGADIGLETICEVGGGGSDANIFNERGIRCAIISTGPQEVHTTGEWASVSHMARAAEWLAAIIQRAAR